MQAYLAKKWLRLGEAAERVKAEKSIAASDSDILHIVIAGKIRAYIVLDHPAVAERYRLTWTGKGVKEEHGGTYMFRHFLPITRTSALELDTRGFTEISRPAIFEDDPLEGFDEEEPGIYWKVPLPITARKDSVVVLTDDLFSFVENLASNGPSRKADRPLETRERRTLLTIIAALCPKAGIKPQERGGRHSASRN